MKTDEFPTYIIIASLTILLSILIIKAPLGYGWSAGPNYENVTIGTKVNITQSMPTITSIFIDDDAEGIILNAGLTREILCNVTVRDWNGHADVIQVNATLWDDNSVNMADSDNPNNHYTNASCTNVGNNGEYLSYWVCGFPVYYYANNGSNWVCNATALDNYNFTDSNHNTTTINPLYALNVTKEIDFGDMAVGDTSETSKLANITNFGNMPINISVYGYGGEDYTAGYGLAFICQIGNITIENEKFSLTDEAWSSMNALSSEPGLIPDLTMSKRVTDEVINTTYWRLYVPPNPFGQCNGTVVFAAETP